MQRRNHDDNHTETELSLGKLAKIGKNSILYWLASIIPQAISFFLLPIYTRYVTPTDYGILALLAALTSPLGVILSLQLNTAVLRFFFAYEGSERSNYLGTMIIFLLVYALPIALGLIFFGKPLFEIMFKSEALTFYPFIVWQIIITYLNLLWVVPSVIYKARQEAGKWVSLTMASYILGTALTYYFIIVHREGALGIIRASLITQSIMCLVYIRITIQNASPNFQWSKLKESLIFSVPLLPSAFTSRLFEISDRWFIERFWDLTQVGLYSLAFKFGLILNLFYTASGSAWMPVFFDIANKDELEAKRLLSKTITVWAAGGGLITLGLGLFSKEVIMLMTSPKYHPAYAVVPLMAFTSLLMGMRFFPRYAFLYAKKTKAILIIALIHPGIIFALNFLLVPRYGMFGAAYSALLANVASSIVTYLLIQRYFPLRLEYAKLTKIISMLVILLVVLNLFSTGSWFFDIPIKIGALLAYCLGLVYFGIIEKGWLILIKDNLNLNSIIRALKM